VTRRRFIFDPPDRFVAGTIGEPGQRTFFLQAREGRRVVSVVLEKVQVAVLADRLGQLLTELERRGLARPAEAQPASDAAPLDEPLNEAFRAGALTLGWDSDAERILIEARSQTDDEADPEAVAEMDEGDDDEDGPDLFRVRVTAPVAALFVDRAVRVVSSGRPPCPLCGQPLDATGHICPRRNGHYVN
jgi:uncharacterized repeat protein (TIGR03847 family)